MAKSPKTDPKPRRTPKEIAEDKIAEARATLRREEFKNDPGLAAAQKAHRALGTACQLVLPSVRPELRAALQDALEGVGTALAEIDPLRDLLEDAGETTSELEA